MHHNDPKTDQNDLKWIKKGYVLIQRNFPEWGITNDTTSVQKLPDDYPECIPTNLTQMRNVEEARLVEFGDHVEQTIFAPRCLVDVKVAIDYLEVAM